ncbi:glycosyltransferase family 4 protein [Chryseobacterium koreense]|uniref:glycosyltransferase family 4 protein n=1 Tax=Chryseobacterium koreense TaxID=232216 RepID=UPI0026EE31CB|nr:glycosyltransferase family 4 protein [Chryseobacterium koreense]
MKKLIRITTVPISLDKLLGDQLRFMNQYFEVTAISADEKELKRVAEKYGVKHFHVEMTRKITPLKDLAAIWKLYRFLRKEKPEMIHTHTPKAGLVGLMAGYLAQVPVRMHTVAGLPLLETAGIKRKVLNRVEWFTCRLATKVYPNSFGLKDIIIKEKISGSKKLKVIGNGSSNGININYFDDSQISESEKQQLRSKLGISERDFVFVFVGRLVRDKGINELVAAFKNLNLNLNLNLKLILVGPFEEDLDPLLLETVEEITTNANIFCVGFQQDVRPYFAVSDALVFPSYREGFPNVVLQAGAMDLPSIVTDINGCNEIIEEGKNGMVIPVKDTAALQQAMENMMRDTDLYHSMKVNSRPLIESRYRQEVVWQALLEEYDRMRASDLIKR